MSQEALSVPMQLLPCAAQTDRKRDSQTATGGCHDGCWTEKEAANDLLSERLLWFLPPPKERVGEKHLQCVFISVRQKLILSTQATFLKVLLEKILHHEQLNLVKDTQIPSCIYCIYKGFLTG